MCPQYVSTMHACGSVDDGRTACASFWAPLWPTATQHALSYMGALSCWRLASELQLMHEILRRPGKSEMIIKCANAVAGWCGVDKFTAVYLKRMANVGILRLSGGSSGAHYSHRSVRRPGHANVQLRRMPAAVDICIIAEIPACANCME